MGTLLEDIPESAAWIAAALRSSGYRADFTPPSLKEIDRFFDEHTAAGTPKPGGLLSAGRGPRMFALSCYLGEVVRRHLGGHWRVDEEDPEGEVDMELVLPGGGVIWPGQRVIKRYRNGSEDGIAAYGLYLGLPVGNPFPERRKSLFRRSK
ncbi:MAG: hypothetical protein ACRDVE_12310 [Actinocrinis sp.]